MLTPPYPDYNSGLNTFMGAVTRTLTGVRAWKGPHRREYHGCGQHPPLRIRVQLNQDAIDARVWSGIHFRTADVIGNRAGTKIGDWALDNYFQPTRKQ